MPALERLDLLFADDTGDPLVPLGTVYGIAALDEEDAVLAKARAWLVEKDCPECYDMLITATDYAGLPGMFMMIHFHPGADDLAQAFASQVARACPDLGSRLIETVRRSSGTRSP